MIHAFDSVNHDLILDGRLLKFLKNYLCEREQCVVLDGKSSSKPVLLGIPQGSIFRTLTFCSIH